MANIRITDGVISSSGPVAFSASAFTFSPPLTGPDNFLGSGILSQSFSESIATRVTEVELGAPAPTTSLVGNTFTVRFGQFSSSTELPLSGTVTSSTDWDDLTNVPGNLVSGAGQLAAAISGATPAFVLSDYASEISGATAAFVLGDYATDISGAFTSPSAAIAANIASNASSIESIHGTTGSYTTLSGSLADGTANLPSESVLGFDSHVSAAAAAYGFGQGSDPVLSASAAALSTSIADGTANIPSESILNFATAVSQAASDFSFGSGVGAQSTDWFNITNMPADIVSASAQLAAAISGATEEFVLSDYSSDISGAFVEDSASFSTRVGTNEANIGTITSDLSTLSGKSLVSGAAQISSEISGAFTQVSAAFSVRITDNSVELAALSAKTLISGAAQIASEISGAGGTSFTLADYSADISGAFTADSTSLASRIDTNTIDAIKTEFSETVFRVVNNSDASKKLRFELSGIGSGITRTITMPNQDVDLGSLGSAASTASQIYFDPAETSQLSSSNVQDILVEVNERLPVTASSPSIPFNNAINGFAMEALEIVPGFVTESSILTDIEVSLFPTPNYSGAVPNFQAGRVAVSGGYRYDGLTYDTQSNSGTVLRTPLFETFEALNLETDTITKLTNEAYWLPNNVYNGPAITGSDLVVGEQYYSTTEANVWFECVTGSTNYWVRRGNRKPAVLSYKLSPYGSDASASVATPKDVDLFEKPFYVIDTIAYASTAPVGSTASVDIYDDGASIFSGSAALSMVRIADGAKSGSQAITGRLIDSGSEISVYLMDTGSSTPGQNYKVSLVGFWKL